LTATVSQSFLVANNRKSAHSYYDYKAITYSNERFAMKKRREHIMNTAEQRK
jgi:hypothetical protein